MNYKNLPKDSRVWVYQSNREFTDKEVEEITQKGEAFVEDWAAHGEDLSAALSVFYNRFIVLFADESKVIASGCSIDTSINFIKSIGNDYQIELFDRLNIAYRNKDKIASMKIEDFQEALSNGELGEDTLVFNNLVETIYDFETAWEVPVKESWHAQLLA